MVKLDRIDQFLFKPVDNSPLIFFRMIFGFLILCESWGAIATGWVEKAYITPKYTFPFMDFSWLEPLPGNGMYVYFVTMGIAGIGVMLGYRYRISMGLFAFMWAGAYLMQKTNYNNHYYLLMVLNFMMLAVPAHQYGSLDVRRNPSLKSLTCPQWCLSIFAFTMAVVYFYAATAKIYPGWLDAEPISIWFNNKRHYFLIGPLLGMSWFQYAVAYGGIFYDLFLGPGLLFKKTRPYAFAASVLFHLFNSAVFHVGIFPYMGIAIGVFFFEPEVVRRLFFKSKPSLEGKKVDEYLYPVKIWKVYLIGSLLLLHILLPLRHWAYPGEVNWTEEGHRLSWRMMLRVKSGFVKLKVVNHEDGSEIKVKLSDYLTGKQQRAIACRPDMLWQFIQILKMDLQNKGIEDYSIYANGMVTLNKNQPKHLYDPNYDLAKAEWHKFATKDWVLKY